MYLNQKFEEAKIPVDVLWMDLPYTNDRQYFTFNPNTFNKEDLEQMKKEISFSDRRLVVITDPHIK